MDCCKETWGWHEDIAKWLSEKTALLPGLGKSKGKFRKDNDADLVVWNPEKSSG